MHLLAPPLSVMHTVMAIICGKPCDWSLNGLCTQDDLLAKNNSRELFETIAWVLEEQGISRAYAPRLADFNASLAEPNEFKTMIQDGMFCLYRGPSASGMKIPPGAALLVPTGDCPTCIMYDRHTGDIVAFHAGLGELIDLKKLKPDWPKPERNHDSVIEEAAKVFSPDARKRVKISVLCGIQANRYCYSIHDPLYGDTNRQIVRHITERYGRDVFLGGDIAAGCISILELIRYQAMLNGFSPERVCGDGICTARDARDWYSNSARKEAGRNMVMILNRNH